MSTNANSLIDFSNQLADAVEQASRSIVMVNARRRLPATGFVWTGDGVVVTANHVVERDDELVVGLPDGREVAATLVGRDPSTDLALLRIQAEGLSPAARASAPARAGNLVLALGKPDERSPVATLGAVSAIGESLETRRGGSVERPIRSDITLYPGFSGGPLINVAGEVLGLNTSGLSRGLPVAVPIAVIDRVAETLLKQGKIARGHVGLALQPVTLPETIQSELGGQAVGLLVVGVDEGGPAASAGVFLGDTLVRFGEHATDDLGALQKSLGPDSVGATRQAVVLRAGAITTLTLTIGER
jgi:S1-C subfamily serine protease